MGFDMGGLGTTMALAKQVEEQKGREIMAQQRQQQEADQAKIFHQALLNSMVDINQPNMPPSYAQVAQTMGMNEPQAQQLYNALRNQAIGNLQAKQLQAQAAVTRAQTAGTGQDIELQKLYETKLQNIIKQQKDIVMEKYKGKINKKTAGEAANVINQKINEAINVGELPSAFKGRSVTAEDLINVEPTVFEQWLAPKNKPLTQPQGTSGTKPPLVF